MVSSAVESIFSADVFMSGASTAGLRIGIPAVLERPSVVAYTGAGDISLCSVTCDCALQSSAGEISVRDASGVLEVTTGMGDVGVSRFDGLVTVRTGSGDAELADCNCGGSVSTGSGEMKALGVSGAWSFRSGAGDIKVRVRGEAMLDVVTGAGDVEITSGSLSRLSLQSGSGDIDCSSLLAGPRHQVSTGHGDITVAIAERPGARLQILTRHGDVDSEYPLVMVGKQGRHSADGGRYVGNIGDSAIDVELRTQSGDIKIKRRSPSPEDSAGEGPASRAAGSPRSDVRQPDFDAEDSAAIRLDAIPPELASPFSPVTSPSAVEAPDTSPASITDEPSGGNGCLQNQSPAQVTGGNPRLAVLENLQSGKITVSEAARLLEALGRRA
jgi:hypothetical protein